MSSIFEDLFIFEMANSHQGSVEHGTAIIKEMAKICRLCNIKGAVKLQYRELDSFIHSSYKGRTDVKNISRFESTRLKKEDFDNLVETIREEGMIPISTPFDETGVEWCMSQGLPVIKIASCSAVDWPLMEEAAKTHKPLLVSTGGKSITDIDKIYNFLTHRGCEFALMHCIAEYPAAEERIQLDFIDRMKKRYHGILIGYSGHEKPDDYTVPMLAAAKGARIFERHVGMETDTIKLNAYSMNPKQAEAWVRAVLRAKEICVLKKKRKSI
ncbi:Spore coat polysaccharide biosynthesis protein SpsE [Eubacterium plexicaudatum ASF492]|nr:Spore coat polysaccharide biosynthesis protein SpsE [Eubacterium plexicaudatum ASF492]